MSFKSRKGQGEEGVLAAAFNALYDSLLTTEIHRDKTCTQSNFLDPTLTTLSVTAANASDYPTTYVVANQLKAVLAIHMADDSAHLVADTTNTNFDGYALATTNDTANALLNAILDDYTAHCTQSGCHVNNDSTNTISAPIATDQSSAVTLANELKQDINAHIANGGTGRVKRINP
jgi:hypothetical protein